MILLMCLKILFLFVLAKSVIRFDSYEDLAEQIIVSSSLSELLSLFKL